MRNSLVFKTSFIIVILQIIILSSIGIYIQNSQTNIIDELQYNQKNYIIEQLNRTEKMAIKKEIDILTTLLSSVNGAIADSLYNIDKDASVVTVEKFINKANIKAVLIYDTTTNEVFVLGYKKNGKLIFSNSFPSYINNLKSLKSKLIVDGEDLGYMKIYYDNKKIIKDIATLKQKDLDTFKKQSLQIGKKVKEEFLYQVISFIFGGLMTILIIVFLLKKFVNKPLILFQNGLTSFFDYLADPNKKVNKIDIDTTDEFGQMTKSVNESITVSMKMHGDIANLMRVMDKNVITSETDDRSIITYVSQAFCKISGYKKEELIGNPHNIVRHPDMSQSIFKDMWSTLKDNKTWEGEIKNLKKDGTFYWVYTIISPKCAKTGASCGYTAIRYDITDKKEVENLTVNLEIKIKERTKELDDEKNFINTIMDSQENFVITSDSKCLQTANKSFYNFYNVKDTNEFIEQFGNCICDTFDTTAPKEYIQKIMGEEGWLDYVNNRPNQLHKTIIKKDGIDYIFTITSEKLNIHGKELKTAIFTDITSMEKAKNEISEIHKHTRDSIEYASLIQGALIPDKSLFDNYFKDSFVIWQPKDIVGGDIYLFEELRDKNECLLMCIDCTGHGVPGAFVTMLVKAIERQIIAKIEHDKYHDIDISPAWILSYFNRKMKQLLKQDNEKSLSNAGFDGGIIYYNKKNKLLKFSGAETPLFYFDQNGEFKIVKGSRHSIGYKKCNINFEYKEHTIEVQEGMKFYIATDGYLDQNGGLKDFPFGKKRFSHILQNHHTKSFRTQKQILLAELDEYQANEDRNDDITVIGFEIKDDGIDSILEYNGELTQGIITHIIDILENKISNINIMSKVSTITIELTQNMMNYSKSYDLNCTKIIPAGFIEVIKDKGGNYFIKSKNIISTIDKEKIEPKLLEIQSLDEKGIKIKYRELRKSGQNTHAKGGGIGFYEIAKLSRDIEFKFKTINKDKYYFEFKVNVERRLKIRKS